jgi:hypothetical protein
VGGAGGDNPVLAYAKTTCLRQEERGNEATEYRASPDLWR